MPLAIVPHVDQLVMEAMTQTDATDLARELATYAARLPELLSEEGKFALIAEDQLLGTYDTYGDALGVGYAKRGLAPFLVKQIASHEMVANFTRSLQAA